MARGPSADDLATAFLRAEARQAAVVLAPLDELEFEALYTEMTRLPEHFADLQIGMPRVITPKLQQIIDAIEYLEADELAEAFEAGVDAMDRPVLREEFAREVLRLRDDGVFEEELAACAVVELASPSQALLISSLVCTFMVAAGTAPTPSGLYLPAHTAA